MLEHHSFLEHSLPLVPSHVRESMETLAAGRKWPRLFALLSCYLRCSSFFLGCTIFPSVFLLLCEYFEIGALVVWDIDVNIPVSP